MTVGIGSICFACKHYRSGFEKPIELMASAFCAAYPDGIPIDIMFGGRDHRSPLGNEQLDENGNPILFELNPAEAEIYEIYLRAVLPARQRLEENWAAEENR